MQCAGGLRTNGNSGNSKSLRRELDRSETELAFIAIEGEATHHTKQKTYITKKQKTETIGLPVPQERGDRRPVPKHESQKPWQGSAGRQNDHTSNEYEYAPSPHLERRATEQIPNVAAGLTCRAQSLFPYSTYLDFMCPTATSVQMQWDLYLHSAPP